MLRMVRARVEALLEPFARLVQHGLAVIGEALDTQVSGENVAPGGQAPRMHMTDVLGAVDAAERSDGSLQIETLRRALHRMGSAERRIVHEAQKSTKPNAVPRIRVPLSSNQWAMQCSHEKRRADQLGRERRRPVRGFDFAEARGRFGSLAERLHFRERTAIRSGYQRFRPHYIFPA